MGKHVRAFNLDNEVGKAIDSEAELLGPNKASALVNELLREALDRRRKDRFVKQTVIRLAEGTASLSVFIGFFWSILQAIVLVAA